jgi:phosphate-selective porin OprO/OprP
MSTEQSLVRKYGVRLRLRGIVALTAVSLSAPRAISAQRGAARDTTLATGITAGEADDEPRPRALIQRLKLNLGFTTLNIGGGVLVDYIMYQQDTVSREQFPDLPSIGKLRDARVLFDGRFKTERPFTWQIGVMYDQVTKRLLFRQTGIMVAVPELWGHFFIGRAKEGFSLNKVMTGYDGWTMERQPFTDASIPLLADGIKWLGYVPSRHFFWNLGLFGDAFSLGQTFSTYSNQAVLRAGWVPMVSDSAGKLLHFAVNLRAGKPVHDSLQLRSRPEAFEAPYFVNTGIFPATSARQLGPELYYRDGPVMFGTEYYWQNVTSPTKGNLWFHGGEWVATWVTTGETRSYNTVGNYFRGISPNKTVIQGGPGAWEVVLKYSYVNLTDGTVQGGKFGRVTPMINWYLTDNLRLEFAYGYGRLNETNIVGRTMFFQSRVQFEM